MCDKMECTLMLQQVVHTVTTRLEMVKQFNFILWLHTRNVIKEFVKTTKIIQNYSVTQHLQPKYYAHSVLPFTFHITLASCLFRNSIKKNGCYVKPHTINVIEQAT